MDIKTRIDVIVKQFERGLQCANCPERNIARIVDLIKQKKIDAISFYASDSGFKVFELIIGIDWNEYDKQSRGSNFNAEDIGGLQKTGETSEIKRYLNALIKKTNERKLSLSYSISFGGALRIIKPEEYYKWKYELGFKDSLYGWMNDLGRDEVDDIPDLQEIKIRLRDIKDITEQDKRRIESSKALHLKCKEVAEKLSPSIKGTERDYNANINVFPMEVSLTFQGQKKAAELLGIKSLKEPGYAKLEQNVISALVRKEEKQYGQRLEYERLEKERLEKERLEKERLERERLEKEHLERERLKREQELKEKKRKEDEEKARQRRLAEEARKKQLAEEKRLKDLLNDIKKVKQALVFYLVTIAVLIATLLFNKCDTSTIMWKHIIVDLPAAAWLVYLFVGGVSYNKKYEKYNTAISTIMFSVGSIFFFNLVFGNIAFFPKLWAIACNVYSVPIFALTTISSVNYLVDKNNKITEKKRKVKNIPILKNLSIILCSVLAVLLLIGVANSILESNALNVGDTVVLGSYEQDGDSSNGKETITWTVKSIDNGKALLLSDVCLDAKPYNSARTDNSWTNSSLRKWLNGEFYQSAFSPLERSVIWIEEITTERLSDEEGSTFRQAYGEAEITIDKVFIPAYSEIEKLTSDLNVSNIAKEVFTSNNALYRGTQYRSMFWTRAPYGEEKNLAYGYKVDNEESCIYICFPDAYAMVRPAICIDIKMYSKFLKNDQLGSSDIVGGWGDSAGGRLSYTTEQIDNGALADTITFNSISDGKIGDEKNFVGAIVSGKDADVWNADSINVKDGETYTIRLYVHNNNPKGHNAVARDVKVLFSVPVEISNKQTIVGYLDSSNAQPSRYWDGVTLKSKKPFYIEYVKGSAKINNAKFSDMILNDEIITKGVNIGYDSLDGRLPGCFEYDCVVTIDVKIHEEK